LEDVVDLLGAGGLLLASEGPAVVQGVDVGLGRMLRVFLGGELLVVCGGGV